VNDEYRARASRIVNAAPALHAPSEAGVRALGYQLALEWTTAVGWLSPALTQRKGRTPSKKAE
jgi:hypothetical protein